MKFSSAQKFGCVAGVVLALSTGAASAYYSDPYTNTYNDPYRNQSYRQDGRYDDRDYQRGTSFIRCESRDRRTTFCGQNIGGGVRLVNRMSQASCVRGSSWGVDRGRLWVSRGCRAQFQIGDVYDQRHDDRNGYGYGNDNRIGYGYGNDNRNGYGYGNSGYRGNGSRMLVCESRDNRYNFCAVGSGQVQIRRQISDSRCVQNSSWGYRDGGIWVDRGCRAEFVIY